MYGDWLKKWWEMMFWWLPGSSDEGERGTRDRDTRETGAGAAEPPVTEATGGQRPEAAGARMAESVEETRDDLTEIKGIGPALAGKLSGLGITSFRDLAHADAARVSEQIGQRTITPQRVQGWISEAKRRII